MNHLERRCRGIWSLHLSHILVALSIITPFLSHASDKYPAPPPEFFQLNANNRSLVIAAGDVLNIRFYYNPELNKVVKVRDDGKISLDLFQGVSAAGQTPEELQQKLVDLYSKEFTKPEVTVDMDSRANSMVYVTGEVLVPGAKDLRGRMNVAMALAISQINQKTAGSKSVFLIRTADDSKYHVYKLDASLPDGSARDIALAPGDILFVPRKGIVKADDFIEQYFRQLLPATPSATAGVIYTPGTNTLTSTTSTTTTH